MNFYSIEQSFLFLFLNAQQVVEIFFKSTVNLILNLSL